MKGVGKASIGIGAAAVGIKAAKKGGLRKTKLKRRIRKMIIKRQKEFSAGHITAVASMVNSKKGGPQLLKELGNTLEHRTNDQIRRIKLDKRFLKGHPAMETKLADLEKGRDKIIDQLNSGKYGTSVREHHRKYSRGAKPGVSAIDDLSAYKGESMWGGKYTSSRKFHEIQGRRIIEN